jgi:hypothetical protein
VCFADDEIAPMRTFVVTGNATVDGGPIYWGGELGWSRNVADALVLDEASAHARSRAAAGDSQAIVCDPYAIEVSTADGQLRPVTLKERIRAEGPTVAYGA